MTNIKKSFDEPNLQGDNTRLSSSTYGKYRVKQNSSIGGVGLGSIIAHRSIYFTLCKSTKTVCFNQISQGIFKK